MANYDDDQPKRKRGRGRPRKNPPAEPFEAGYPQGWGEGKESEQRSQITDDSSPPPEAEPAKESSAPILTQTEEDFLQNRAEIYRLATKRSPGAADITRLKNELEKAYDGRFSKICEHLTPEKIEKCPRCTKSRPGRWVSEYFKHSKAAFERKNTEHLHQAWKEKWAKVYAEQQ